MGSSLAPLIRCNSGNLHVQRQPTSEYCGGGGPTAEEHSGLQAPQRHPGYVCRKQGTAWDIWSSSEADGCLSAQRSSLRPGAICCRAQDPGADGRRGRGSRLPFSGGLWLGTAGKPKAGRHPWAPTCSQRNRCWTDRGEVGLQGSHRVGAASQNKTWRERSLCTAQPPIPSPIVFKTRPG